MDIIVFISWTCAIIFAATGIITLLSITNVIKIPEAFRKKLFTVLILEIVGIAIWGFNNYLNDFSNSDDWNYVAITTPQINIANNDIDTILVFRSSGTLLFNGVVQYDKSKSIIPRFEYLENDQIIYSTILDPNDSGIFNFKIPNNNFTNNTNCIIRAYLEQDGKSLKEYKINGYIRYVD